MKLKTTLLAITLAAFATSYAFAADEAPAKKTETPAAEKTEAKKPAKRHNHMEEKTGMPMSAPKAQGDAHDDAHADKASTKKHFHPTDR